MAVRSALYLSLAREEIPSRHTSRHSQSLKSEIPDPVHEASRVDVDMEVDFGGLILLQSSVEISVAETPGGACPSRPGSSS